MAIFGLIIGALAKLVMPGKDPGGIWITMALGIAGSLLATFVLRAVGTTMKPRAPDGSLPSWAPSFCWGFTTCTNARRRRSEGPDVRKRIDVFVAAGPVSRILCSALSPVGPLTANPRRQRAGRRSFLWAAHYSAALATYPEVVTHRASTCVRRRSPRFAQKRRESGSPKGRSSPIWSCSVWGFPCHRHYWRSGALLPHLFTLTPPDHPTKRNIGACWGPRKDGAVCFLWHFPSTPLERRRPDVIRHTALWSSDFPLPARATWSAAEANSTSVHGPAATVRPSS